MNKRSIIKKVTSFVLAAAMMFSAVVVMPKDVSAADVSLAAKGGTISITDATCSEVTGEVTWITYKPKSNGYLQLSFSSATQMYSYAAGVVQLYDASRNKALSTQLSYNTNSTEKSSKTECYGVQKGKTYTIGVVSYGGVSIKATFKKVTDKSGKKKSKALTIAKKKNVTGMITAGTTAAHWYKFKLTKNQKINFNITPYLTDTVNVTLSGPGVYTKTFKIGSSAWGKKDPITTTGSVKAGTYYVQVKPASKTCTGYYVVNWK